MPNFPKSSSLRENNISNRPTLVNILPQPPTRAPYGQTKLWKRTPIDFHAEAPPLPSLCTVILAWHAIEGSHRWPRGTGYNTESVQERKKEGGGLTYRERLQSSRVYRGGWRVLRLIPTAPANRIPIPPIPIRVSSPIEEKSVALCRTWPRIRCAFIKRGENEEERERPKEGRIRIR